MVSCVVEVIHEIHIVFYIVKGVPGKPPTPSKLASHKTGKIIIYFYCPVHFISYYFYCQVLKAKLEVCLVCIVLMEFFSSFFHKITEYFYR